MSVGLVIMGYIVRINLIFCVLEVGGGILFVDFVIVLLVKVLILIVIRLMVSVNVRRIIISF